jgi:hypothetical protein
MAIVLASYGAALALEHVAHLHLDIVTTGGIFASEVSTTTGPAHSGHP